MHVPVLAGRRRLVADVAADSLVAAAVAARRHLVVAPLRRQPHLDVDRLGCLLCHIGGDQQRRAEVQPQPPHDVLGVRHEPLKQGSALFRRAKAVHLNLVELMHADQALFVGAVGARLASETRRVGGVPERQRLLGQDLVAVQAGQRRLARRQQVERVVAAPVQVVFELRQLAGGEHGRLVHQQRRQHGRVAVLAHLHVPHERDEGPLELRAKPDVHREPRLGHPGRAREIEQAERVGQLEVAARREVEIGLGGVLAQHGFVVGILAGGHVVVGHVGHLREQLVERGLGLARLAAQLGHLVAQRSEARLGGARVAARALERADLLRRGVQPGLFRLRFLEQAAPRGVGLDDGRDNEPGLTSAQGRLDRVGVVSNRSQLKHRSLLTPGAVQAPAARVLPVRARAGRSRRARAGSARRRAARSGRRRVGVSPR